MQEGLGHAHRLQHDILERAEATLATPGAGQPALVALEEAEEAEADECGLDRAHRDPAGLEACHRRRARIMGGGRKRVRHLCLGIRTHRSTCS